MRSSAGFFSLRLAGRLAPVTRSPLRSAELPDLLDRDVHVVAARQVAVDPQEAVALVAQVEQALDLDGLAGERLVGPVGPLAPLRAVAAIAAVTAPAASATAARSRRRSAARCPSAPRRLAWSACGLVGRVGGAGRPLRREWCARRGRSAESSAPVPAPPPARSSSLGASPVEASPVGASPVGASPAALGRRRGRSSSAAVGIGRRLRSPGAAATGPDAALGLAGASFGPPVSALGRTRVPAVGDRSRLVGGRARPRPPEVTPASSRMRLTMSAFLARDGGLLPRAVAMVMSSSRSLRSSADRSSCWVPRSCGGPRGGEGVTGGSRRRPGGRRGEGPRTAGCRGHGSRRQRSRRERAGRSGEPSPGDRSGPQEPPRRSTAGHRRWRCTAGRQPTRRRPAERTDVARESSIRPTVTRRRRADRTTRISGNQLEEVARSP